MSSSFFKFIQMSLVQMVLAETRWHDFNISDILELFLIFFLLKTHHCLSIVYYKLFLVVLIYLQRIKCKYFHFRYR